MKYELLEYTEISKEFGYGWKVIAEFDSKEQAEKEKENKPNKYNYMVREKRQEPTYKSTPYFFFREKKDIHKGLSASQRRELWNSDDPKDFKKLM